MPFEFLPFSIPGLMLIKPKLFNDDRGVFFEMYKHSDFSLAGIREHLLQDNYSTSTKGVLRGLHYQKNPKAQGKLVCCVKGKIYDVAIDIRRGSPCYGKWAGIELTEDNRHLLYVPPGFAHGFQVLSETAEVMYKCTEEYSPADDRGIMWNDPHLAITWPLPNPLLSKKDVAHPSFGDADNNFVFVTSK
jgi:dTDP-4-dehydrorhamnose 3,5-epimerase